METTAHQLAASRGFLHPADVDLIHELVDSLAHIELLRVADLGAGSGTTALAVLERRAPGSVSVITVDVNPENLYWAGELIKNVGRTEDWEGVVDDAAHFIREASLGFDLVLLDTSHTYEGTVEELHAIAGKTGLLWCHDYGLAPALADDPDQRQWEGYPGVQMAIDEAVDRGEYLTIKTAGLGWAGRPK